jgi:hypothetical protein
MMYGVFVAELPSRLGWGYFRVMPSLFRKKQGRFYMMVALVMRDDEECLKGAEDGA